MLINSKSENHKPTVTPMAPQFRFMPRPLPPVGSSENPIPIDYSDLEVELNSQHMTALDILLRTERELNKSLSVNREIRNDRNRADSDLHHARLEILELKDQIEALGQIIRAEARDEETRKCAVCMVDDATRALIGYGCRVCCDDPVCVSGMNNQFTRVCPKYDFIFFGVFQYARQPSKELSNFFL